MNILIYLLFLGPLTVLNMVLLDGNKHENDIQMRLCIVKLGVVSSMYGDFGAESGRSRGGDTRTRNLPLTEIYKGIFAQVPAY